MHRGRKVLWVPGCLGAPQTQGVQSPALADPRRAPGHSPGGPAPTPGCPLTQRPRAQQGADGEPHPRCLPERYTDQAPTRLGQLHLSSGWGRGGDAPPPKGSPFRAVTFATPPPRPRAAGPPRGWRTANCHPLAPCPEAAPSAQRPSSKAGPPGEGYAPRGYDRSNLEPAGRG